MGLFEDVVVNAKEAVNAVGKKAGQMVDISKLRLSDECITTIDDLYEQLDAVNDQISALRSKVICKKCGAENPAEACYCNMCGSKFDAQ